MKKVEQSYEIYGKDKIDGMDILRKIETIMRLSYKSAPKMLTRWITLERDESIDKQQRREEIKAIEDNAAEVIKRLYNHYERNYWFGFKHDIVRDADTLQFIYDRMHDFHLGGLEHEILTIKFICNRGVSHELVRHRPASYVQESTRFCNYSGERFGKSVTYIDPHFNEVKIETNSIIDAMNLWEALMIRIEEDYMVLTDKLKFPAQYARDMLPNATKTEIYVTANLREWFEVIMQQRISKAAHPHMQELMKPLFAELRRMIPLVFDYTIKRELIPIEE